VKQYPLLNSRAAKVAFSLFLTATLFLSRDTLTSSCLIGFARSQILMLGLIVLLGLWFLWVNRKETFRILKDPRMLLLAASALLIVLPMAAKRDWQLMYFSILLCVLTAVFITYFTSVRETAKYYVVILVVLGLYSMFATYVLKYMARAEIITPGIFYNSNEWKFYNFWFTYAVPSRHWHRNFGIFREPGVYQFFVLLAVYLNNYAVDWNRPWKLWLSNVVLAFTMLSTFAIGGFAELGLLIVFLYFDKKWYRETWGKKAGIAFVLAVIAAVMYIVYRVLWTDFVHSVFYEFYDMFIRLFTGSESSTDRWDAVVTNLRFIARSPLAGEPIADVLHGTNHNTSSTLLLYAIFGILGGTLNVAGWIALLWKRERRVAGNLILMVTVFLSFNTQNLVANVFFWLFPMMALVERGLPLLKKE